MNRKLILGIAILAILTFASSIWLYTERQTVEPFMPSPTTEPFIPPPTSEPAPLPLTTNGYVYDNKLNYGFDYPNNWEFSIGIDKDVEQCDPTMYYEAYNCVEFPDANIKKVITFTKKIPKTNEGAFISVDIEFIVESAADLQKVINEFKKGAEMSGLPILNEETISVNNINGDDILVGEEGGWKLRQVVFFANGTAYIFKYSSQDEFYRMYEETFNNIINSFNLK